jgi:hypothetical protein
VDRIKTQLARVPRPNDRVRFLLPPVTGIVIGVLLIATGLTLLQLVGVAAIGFGLLLARGWVRIPDTWWSNPRGQFAVARRGVRRRIPVWAGQATVAVLIGVGAIALARHVVSDGLGASSLGDLGKGAIALAMMATLLFWSADRLPVRLRRRNENSSKSQRPKAVSDPGARADT